MSPNIHLMLYVREWSLSWDPHKTHKHNLWAEGTVQFKCDGTRWRKGGETGEWSG
jgi:hypothetical protein